MGWELLEGGGVVDADRERLDAGTAVGRCRVADRAARDRADSPERRADERYGGAMRLHVAHRRGYHEWPASTPVIDAIGAVVAVMSVVIGSYAGLFLILAAGAGEWDTAADNALFFVVIAVANGIVDAVRRWYRHHG
jgi:hypothetical protein